MRRFAPPPACPQSGKDTPVEATSRVIHCPACGRALDVQPRQGTAASTRCIAKLRDHFPPEK